MANELAANHYANNLRTAPGTGFPERSSMGDISRLIARCLANYGERKGADMRLLAAEWHASLRAYRPDRLNAALGEHIRKSQFWPTIANFIEHVQQDTPQPGLPHFRDEVKSFCQEGRTEAEEQAHRAEQLKRWKQQAGFDRLLADDGRASEVRPASQAGASLALLATQAARRMRGEIQ
jgi:hypothetical protein